MSLSTRIVRPSVTVHSLAPMPLIPREYILAGIYPCSQFRRLEKQSARHLVNVQHREFGSPTGQVSPQPLYERLAKCIPMSHACSSMRAESCVALDQCCR